MAVDPKVMAVDPVTAALEGVKSVSDLGTSFVKKGETRIQSKADTIKAALEYKAKQEEAAAKQSKMKSWVIIGGVSVLAILAIGVAAKVARSK